MVEVYAYKKHPVYLFCIMFEGCFLFYCITKTQKKNMVQINSKREGKKMCLFYFNILNINE